MSARGIMRRNAMEPSHYALVAYVTNPVGQFVEGLRRELIPEQHMAAHLTILPPRLLSSAQQDAVDLIEQVCQTVEPFEISLGDVETFLPLTPTVFIRVEHAAFRMRELHDRLNTAGLHFHEPWPYMPHLTVLRTDDVERARHAFEFAREHWSHYHGTRRVTLDRLTFVRQDPEQPWHDVAPVLLGRQLAPAAR